MTFSRTEYEAILARQRHQRAADGLAAAEAGCDNERDLHDRILAECRRRQWIVFHGSMGIATHRTPGEPDFIILAPGRVLLIECKTRTGKLTPEQEGLIRWAARLGHHIHVIRSFDQFLQLIA